MKDKRQRVNQKEKKIESGERGDKKKRLDLCQFEQKRM